ncbi:rhodanese-like domain-containing protein [Candidatus Accumulibacter sp. ACC003]|uniref:rhodanese-like domain-containing protein n=1 Tax=Candidatus Accumulibacter sp. ACC003 TaxID=2823334 RepID=UPI0025C19486|nr:rhodanese-like domain-containing protein [Candidatus Accumulibacter sp. ACC003]
MFTRTILGLATLISLAAAPLLADEIRPATPTRVEGARIVTIEEAKAMLDGKAATFFDMRSPLNYGKGHVPGATLIAYKEKSDYTPDFAAAQDSFAIARLPADKDVSIVIYSDGPAGWKSYKATVLSVRAGYRNVHWLRDGFAGWLAKGLPVE